MTSDKKTALSAAVISAILLNFIKRITGMQLDMYQISSMYMLTFLCINELLKEEG